MAANSLTPGMVTVGVTSPDTAIGAPSIRSNRTAGSPFPPWRIAVNDRPSVRCLLFIATMPGLESAVTPDDAAEQRD